MNSKDTSRVLQAIAREAVPQDLDLLPGILKRIDREYRSTMKPSSRLTTAAVLFLVVLAVILASVPGAVNAMKRLFGYIPGVGVVEQGAPMRVLAAPVTVTREGISVSVTSAILSGDRTHIEYRIFGVPASAYPNREDVMGCTTPEYLRLPDGTQVARSDNDYGPIPAEVNEAFFVMPCIFNTLPGTVPTDWELPLSFVPVPPDLTVAPVIDLSPSPEPSRTAVPAALPGISSAAPTGAGDRSLTVIKEIETQDGYILVGQFSPPIRPGDTTNGEVELQDAGGKKVAHTTPPDVGPNALGLDPNGSYWFGQIKAAGLAYPLTIRYAGDPILPADTQATAQFSFDAGSNPQPGQEWTPHQEIRLAGHTLELLSIAADSRNGYNFGFQGDPQVYSADVQIQGYTPVGGGGGWGGKAGSFHRSVSFAQIPTGVLTVILSNLTVTGEPLTWQGQWTPAAPRTDLPANPTPQPGVCLAADTLEQLGPAPVELAKGKALVYEPLEGGNGWGLALYSLDGSQKKVVASSGNWGALSPDGSKEAYSALDNGIHIVEVDTLAEQVLQNASGYDLHWSPDGRQIAYVGSSGVFVVDADGANNRQVSGLSYGGVVGWSPDGARLYFVAPYTGGAAWKVYALDLPSDVAQELFTIENGTPKFLDPTLSPDGQWIAYRGRDNSSLYLVHPDGTGMHLALDNIGVAGNVWSSSGWLGVSLSRANSDDRELLLLRPEGCQAYRAPGLGGELQGLFIP
jgi:hypothetical protein